MRSDPWRRATLAPYAEGAGGPSQRFDTRCEEVAYSPTVGDLTAVLRPLYEARDRETGVEAMLAICAPDVVLRPGGLWLDDASVCHGREEVAEFFGRLADAFEDMHFAPERFEERGDSVAVLVRLEVRGRHSGISDSRTLGHLWSFRDGQAIEIRAFNEPDDAFAAL